MSRIQERKKQRREYLKRKGKAYVSLATMSGTLVIALAAILCCTGFLIWCFSNFKEDGRLLAGTCLLLSVVAALQGWFVWQSGRAVKESRQQLRIPHVPPVTPDTLPAEEVLVRGSEQPAQTQKEVLVRPAAAGDEETKAQELLRSSQE